jgi:hypothetical protein
VAVACGVCLGRIDSLWVAVSTGLLADSAESTVEAVGVGSGRTLLWPSGGLDCTGATALLLSPASSGP